MAQSLFFKELWHQELPALSFVSRTYLKRGWASSFISLLRYKGLAQYVSFKIPFLDTIRLVWFVLTWNEWNTGQRLFDPMWCKYCYYMVNKCMPSPPTPPSVVLPSAPDPHTSVCRPAPTPPSVVLPSAPDPHTSGIQTAVTWSRKRSSHWSWRVYAASTNRCSSCVNCDSSSLGSAGVGPWLVYLANASSQ